jgi:hypothetical protein
MDFLLMLLIGELMRVVNAFVKATLTNIFFFLAHTYILEVIPSTDYCGRKDKYKAHRLMI